MAIDPLIGAALISGVGSAVSSRGQGGSTQQRTLAPLSTPLYDTRFVGDISNPASTGGAYLNTGFTPLGQGLLDRFQGDLRSIPLSDITSPGFTYGQSDKDLLGRADTMFDRAGTALDRAQTPEASLGFLERAFGPQLAQARAAQENRLFNQGLLGSTAGSLQTEALSRGQQGALLEGALQQQQFQGQLGQGLLGSALNTRQLFGDINLQRVNQDLAQRQLLANQRQQAFGNLMTIARAPEQGAEITLRGATTGGTTPPNYTQQAIGNALQGFGLGLLGTQQPSQTVQPRTPQYTPGGTSYGGGAPINTRGIGPGFTYGIH